MISWFVLLILTLICAVTDYRTYRIYNVFTMPAIALGTLYHMLMGKGLYFSILGLSLGLLIGAIGCLFYCGGGDAMLLTAVGSWTGTGGLILVLYLALMHASLWFLKLYICHKVKKTPMPKVIPFGVCIFTGTLVTNIMFFI